MKPSGNNHWIHCISTTTDHYQDQTQFKMVPQPTDLKKRTESVSFTGTDPTFGVVVTESYSEHVL